MALNPLSIRERLQSAGESVSEADIQEVEGKVKPCQVKQMRTVLRKYNLREEL